MKKTYLFWFAMIAFLSLGCRNEDFSNSIAESKREEEFFRANLKTLSEEQKQILNYLQNENSKNNFVGSLKDKVGLPIWDKMVVQTEESTADLSKANPEEKTYLVIPVAKDEDELSSVIYAKKVNGSFDFHNITNATLRNFVFDTSIAKSIREEVLMAYLFADHYVYGTRCFVRLPNDLFPQFIKNGRLSMQSFQTNGKSDSGHSDNSPGTSNFAVPIWECLELRDVNKCGCQTLICDMCPACVSSYCSIIWVSGGGGSGDGTGSPGDTGGDTGGGTGGSTDCSTGGWYKIIPDGCGDGDENTPPDPKCATTNVSITNANNILKNPEVQTKMDAELKAKRNALNEFAVSVGKNPNGSYSVTPPKEGTPKEGTVPPVLSGNYVADGHTHPDGHYGTPSAGDFYNFILKFPNNPYLQSRFVYGSYYGDAEVYALVVDNKTLAQNFVNAYPMSTNYNETTHMFLQNSSLDLAFKESENFSSGGTIQSNTDEIYSHSALAMAYVLDKFNTGISLAKVDANGDLKRLTVKKETIVVPGGTGVPKIGLKVTKCP